MKYLIRTNIGYYNSNKERFVTNFFMAERLDSATINENFDDICSKIANTNKRNISARIIKVII